MTSPDPSLALAASFESLHVHRVYDEIASDFSRTRHSRWPFVERFLDSLPSSQGALVLDAGTGNGKYLGCRSVLPCDQGAPPPRARDPNGKRRAVDTGDSPADEPPRPSNTLLPIGFDMSAGLLAIASSKGHEVVRGDCVDLRCWRRGAFSHAISIATIHHFATPERRVEAVKQMILAVLPTSPPPVPTPSSSSSSSSSSSTAPRSAPRVAKLLIVVWSLEQDPTLAARGGDRSARRTTGGKKGAVPVPVPGAGPGPGPGAAAGAGAGRGVGEAEGGGGGGAGAGDVSERGRGQEGQDVFVPWEKQEQVPRREKGTPRRGKAKAKAATMGPSSEEEPSHAHSPPDGAPAAPEPEPAASAPAPAAPKPTFNRYYHLFQHLELSSLVARAAAALSLRFSAPEAYALDPSRPGGGGGGGGGGVGQEQAVQETRGWEAYVRLEEERWERENWVVEVAVGWRRCSEEEQA